MKITIQTMIDNSDIPPKLIRAVIAQSGGWESFKESARDMARQIDGGFSGWIFYTETVKFTQLHKDNIIDMAEGMADQFGQGTMEMILGFGCMKNLGATVNELSRVIYTGRDTKDGIKTQVYNCLAWYAAESVARLYDDLCDGI